MCEFRGKLIFIAEFLLGRSSSPRNYESTADVCMEVFMTYDWDGRKTRSLRAVKLTIISLTALFVLTAPILAYH